ncbi:MAG TPA: glucosyl-3-phosphoglycerate synthase [Thermoplasmatales archaeon]|nr:glucosyl-3-phosphoglycerate synthase [Thermoplasmatales archaeon]
MDFKQDVITTLHDLQVDNKRLEREIKEYSEDRPLSVIVPMLYDDLKRESADRIIEKLNHCTYINEIIVALAAKNEKEYRETVRAFSRIDIPHLIVWCNGPSIRDVLMELKNEKLDILKYKGKGRDVWIALGIATIRSHAIALHDADIITYDEYLPAKLLYPLIEPSLDYSFNKGYYARIGNNTLYGRVTRLFVQPLIEALIEKLGYEVGFLSYLRSFRYPLSGEFAIKSDVALDLNLPADWGLEIGILSEVYKSISVKHICQTDLGIYDHKHQGVGDLSRGLVKMSGDIFKAMLRHLTEGVHIDVTPSTLQSLQVIYRRIARDYIKKYFSLARFNGLKYNRHKEETTVEQFSEVIITAGKQYVKRPIGNQIPSWLRAMSAVPGIRDLLLGAVERDLELYGKI